MRLSLTLLATTLFTSLTLGQKNAIFDKLPQVEYNLCAPAFHYKQREYLGCIEVDSPGRPWCQLAKPHGKDKQIRGFCKVDSVPTASSIDKKGNSVSCNPWSNTPSGKVHGCYAENSKSKKFLCDVGNKTVQCSGLQKDTSAGKDILQFRLIKRSWQADRLLVYLSQSTTTK
ncbi:hypothetical protein K493DRAFT_75840 [Basidiobolus meristosporus CBS 931.73]|uniref:Fibronectin type-II domain-containing protein n=1 Tax=Basidiobolus meristosporus CBS 931.73 TaxID=1314790 RepID=A0A1Y1XSG4_9FUNG|nr:hypothetical protein K493DRAFT_75840 [Basidiobolus meristosporus CBS 931.73]|eukprot:ORX88699.1 hypothetical protein K493DRAFT_75840 [Basidiobolus meristosporus CBS 931.73]